MAKSRSITTIQNRALYNLYGDSTPEASASAAAAPKLFDILERVQRKHDFFWQRQKKTFNTVAATADYAFTGTILPATDEQSIGRIYDITLVANSVRRDLERISRYDYDGFPAASGIPTSFMETYLDTLAADQKLYLYPTPDAVYAVTIYYKKIYIPLVWTDNAYTSVMLDELEEYLVAKLTSELAMIVGNDDAFNRYAMIADEYLYNGVLSKNHDKYIQETDGQGVFKDI